MDWMFATSPRHKEMRKKEWLICTFALACVWQWEMLREHIEDVREVIASFTWGSFYQALHGQLLFCDAIASPPPKFWLYPPEWGFLYPHLPGSELMLGSVWCLVVDQSVYVIRGYNTSWGQMSWLLEPQNPQGAPGQINPAYFTRMFQITQHSRIFVMYKLLVPVLRLPGMLSGFAQYGSMCILKPYVWIFILIFMNIQCLYPWILNSQLKVVALYFSYNL